LVKNNDEKLRITKSCWNYWYELISESSFMKLLYIL